jgi:predicted esterase
MDRRRFGELASGMLASLLFGACRLEGEQSPWRDGRLTARPGAAGATPAGGSRRLGLENGRDATLHLPDAAGSPAPLLVLLHGAGGNGDAILRRLGAAADEAGVAVLAPDSRGSTWDAIRGDFGPDVAYLNRALDRVFETLAIDERRLAIGGFSDGASYALSLGLINGDLFPRVLAFSPGFIVEGASRGKPAFFVSHGTADQILPIDRSSRIIVPSLRRRGCPVTYREFDGPHQIPAEIAREGLRWLAS